jgi:hypothetical protein
LERGWRGREWGREREMDILVRASILLTTTAHPTALAEAGTSYSQIAVKIGNNFIELEINNAVEITLPLIQSNTTPGRTSYTPITTEHPSAPRDVTPLSPRHREQGKTCIVKSMDFRRDGV